MNKIKKQTQKKIPAQLATPSDLEKKGRQEIAEALNILIADIFALYLKTKNFHWHLFGSHFRDYHLLFDEQADQIFAMIDVLAERVRKLGEPTIRSVGQINNLKRIKDDDQFLDPTKMLNHLLNDNKELVVNMRAAHQICDDNDDCATASILEVFIDETERRVWFLFATLS